MQLRRYLERIAYDGDLRPSIDVLTALQRAHACTIPFENLDVQLGRAITTAAEDAYEKIVINHRGGWCYEQNGLFGWALTEIGFDVTRVAGAVMRQDRGDIAAANHLCLKVLSPESDSAYLVDVGFGGSLLQPIALRESEHAQAPFQLGLRKLDDGYWRFWESIGRGEFGFDFRDEAANEDALRAKSEFLQIDPSSGFVLNSVAQLRTPDRHKSLRGRVFSVATNDGVASSVLKTADQFVATLAQHFALHLPAAADLWPRINARHDQLMSDKIIEDTFEIRDRANR